MNKVLVTIILLACISSFSYSQSRIEFGLIAEGSWFLPEKSSYSPPNKNGFGAGMGVYASKSIFGRLLADVGVMYRFKEMQEFYSISNSGTGGYGGTGTGYSPESIQGWKKFPLHYVVVPVHLQFLLSKNLFVRSGIEANWLTNYDKGNEKAEFNWTLGFGSQKNKLKWSVNYIRGFKDVSFANNLYTYNGMHSATVYRNNMIQLSLSYPLWRKQ